MSNTTSNAPDERQRELLRVSARDDRRSVHALRNEAAGNPGMDQAVLHHALQQATKSGDLALTRLLVERGASVDPQGDEVGALIKAAGTGNTNLTRVLLDAPGQQVNVDVRDKLGRTALYAAAWGGNLELVTLLLERGASVDARDREERTPLVHLAAEKQWIWNTEMIEFLLGHGADVEAIDNTRRTALLWAASNGKPELCKLLLGGSKAKAADVKAANNRGRTALHLAAENNHASIVAMLLEAGADPQATSDGNWTALHNCAEKGHVDVVKLLLNTWADVNAETSSGMTALHWAAYNGHKQVVELIMERPGVMLSTKDTFNSTPLLRAAEKGHMDIVHSLSPYRQVERLSEAAKRACAGMEATIVDFGIEGSQRNPDHRKGQLVFKRSVHDVLYGWDEKLNKPVVETIIRNIKSKPAFRWIHLPANNITWIETLLTKSFIEGGARDVDDFKHLLKCFGQEHRGRRPHAHFMRTFCQRMGVSVLRPKCGGPIDPSRAAAPPPEGNATAGASEYPSQGPSKPKEKDTPSKSSNAPVKEAPTKAEKKKAKNDKNQENGVKGPRIPNPYSNLKSAHGQHGKVVLFMPYLHYESDERRVDMSNAIQKNERAYNPNTSHQHVVDECLIEAYINHSPQLHVRRTLDQFFYHGIDTQKRDQDQVVWRHCDQNKMEHKVFMVDQLWCWILDTNLIITSFPQRWDQPKNDPLNVLDGIIEDINSKTRPPARSVYDLAMLVTGRCSGVFDRHRLGHQELQFLDFFDTSIGQATEKETKLFDKFNKASEEAAGWLQRHRRLRHRRGTSEKYRSRGNDEIDDILFVDALLDIRVETRLLAEIKDIRDELQMIAKVLKEQRAVIPDLADRLSEELGGKRTVNSMEISKQAKEQVKVLETQLNDVDRMDKQAEGIYKSITHLLDLKQKHANAFEARFARDQAELTAQQGQTIMVFTIVTIVFLPLSFIAAFFAINIKEFASNSGGLNLLYVSKYTFGIGFGISIPLIVIAFSVGDVVAFFRGLSGRIFEIFLRRWGEGADGESRPPDERSVVGGRLSRSSYHRRRRSDAYASVHDTGYKGMNDQFQSQGPTGGKSEGVDRRDRGIDDIAASAGYRAPMRTLSRRTESSWRFDLRGRTSRETDRYGAIV